MEAAPNKYFLHLQNELFMQVKKEGTVSCQLWDFPDFASCAESRLRREILAEGFRCHTLWWKKYFPGDVPACGDTDVNEIVRFRSSV